MDKPKLAISFSGGRTSAVMTKLCLEKYVESHDIAVTFANTGCEHPDTLRFVDACDRNWGFGTVWLEAVVHKERGEGVTHKIVDYATSAKKRRAFCRCHIQIRHPKHDQSFLHREIKDGCNGVVP